MNISGAAAIVTGGGSGLGRATAEALAAKGARVAIADLNMAAAQEVAAAVGGVAVLCDVASEASAAEAVAKAEAAHGPARILVNCAGIGNPVRIVGKDGGRPLERFREVVRVNLIGTFNMIRLAAAGMAKLDPVEGERGVIVSTASVAAFEGQVGQSAYSASKGGVAAMTLPIARDFADRRPGEHDRARHLHDPDARGPARGLPGLARRLGAVPLAARRPGGICRARGPHRRERLHQRRDDPHRRRAAHGAAVRPVAAG